MGLEIKKVDKSQKDILYRYLQYALYDGSQYIDNETDQDGKYPYKWYNNYFADTDRDAYFIYINDCIAGFAMVNENLKFCDNGKCIAEF